MRKRSDCERGSALVEFCLCFALFWTPLFLGSYWVGFNVLRAMQVTQVCRTAAHMYAFGTDFSQAGYQNLLVSMAPGLNMTVNGGNGVVILSTLTYVDQTACNAAAASNSCPNLGKIVVTRRIVIGNASLDQSSFATPTASLVGSGGYISNTNYVSDSSVVAPGFQSLIPSLQSSSQFAYLAEMWVISPDLNRLQGTQHFGNSGSSSRAIF